MPASISLTEIQSLSALETFIQGVVSSAQFEGSIVGEVLTVTQVFSGELVIGQLISDPTGTVTPGTRINRAPSYLNGGVGEYGVNIPQVTPRLIMQGVVEIIRGQENRVPEPLAGDFVVMTSIRRKILSFNETEFYDGAFEVEINGNVLSVDSVIKDAPTLLPGVPIADTMGMIAPNSVLGQQISGTPGGVGTYFISPAQIVPGPIAAYAGLRADMTPTQLAVQVDVHGPLSGDNAQVIATLFRSEYATQAFSTTGYDVTPLYIETPHQTPFFNAEQQIEYRWTIDLEMQVNPIVSTPQQFFDEIEISYTEVESGATGKVIVPPAIP